MHKEMTSNIAKSKSLDNEQTIDVKKVKVEELPKRIIMSKTVILSKKMHGQSCAVTMSFPEGKLITDPETIQMLIDEKAPIFVVQD